MVRNKFPFWMSSLALLSLLFLVSRLVLVRVWFVWRGRVAGEVPFYLFEHQPGIWCLVPPAALTPTVSVSSACAITLCLVHLFHSPLFGQKQRNQRGKKHFWWIMSDFSLVIWAVVVSFQSLSQRYSRSRGNNLIIWCRWQWYSF